MFFRRDMKRTCVLAVAIAAVMMVMTGCDDTPGYSYPTPIVPTPEPPPPGYVWTELPEISEDLPAKQKVVTHFETFGGKRGRNYTMLYDTEERVAYWVAYPQHTIYLNNTPRQDNWAYDPEISKLPSVTQMPIVTGGYGKYGYDRGHQIAAADRTSSRAAMDQTFYVTNMTPQNSTLNGGQWANLEKWVRDRALQPNRYDTLYVVTGCAIRTASDPTVQYIETRGVKSAVPKAYFKVLLRTRSAKPKFPSDSDFECIGFWMENAAPSQSYTKYVKSVAEIEQLAGFTFFPSLSTASKRTLNPAQWAIN